MIDFDITAIRNAGDGQGVGHQVEHLGKDGVSFVQGIFSFGVEQVVHRHIWLRSGNTAAPAQKKPQHQPRGQQGQCNAQCAH